jgi:hypothetical protein
VVTDDQKATLRPQRRNNADSYRVIDDTFPAEWRDTVRRTVQEAKARVMVYARRLMRLLDVHLTAVDYDGMDDVLVEMSVTPDVVMLRGVADATGQLVVGLSMTAPNPFNSDIDKARRGIRDRFMADKWGAMVF